MNKLKNIALVADYVSGANISKIADFLKDDDVSNFVLFLSELDERPELPLNFRVEESGNILKKSLVKLKEVLYSKKTKNEQSFDDNEIKGIFSFYENIDFDLILVASSEGASLSKNFLLDANYSEIYFTESVFSIDFFDIKELELARDFFYNTERNFGS